MSRSASLFSLVLVGAACFFSLATSTIDEPLVVSVERRGDTVVLDDLTHTRDFVIVVAGNDSLFDGSEGARLMADIAAHIECPVAGCGTDANAPPVVRMTLQAMHDDEPSGSARIVTLDVTDEAPFIDPDFGLSFGAEVDVREFKLFVRFERISSGPVPARVAFIAYGAAQFLDRTIVDSAPSGSTVLVGFEEAPAGFEPIVDDADAGITTD
jgi:hypothetical protein